MSYGSTIRRKKGTCKHPGCSVYGPLTKGLCQNHYWRAIRMKSVAKMDEKEISQNESLATVIDDLDAIFSQYIRLRDSNENGYITCYCGKVVYWIEADNSHYIPRAHMNTRFLEENCHASCRYCNQTLSGNLEAYGAFLEEKRPGLVESLEDQAAAPYKYDVPELKSLISYYSKEVKAMKAKKPMKI